MSMYYGNRGLTSFIFISDDVEYRPLKLIIAGSRTIDKYQAAWKALLFFLKNENIESIVTELVTGECLTGPDQVPDLFYQELSDYAFVIKRFSADWDGQGRAAGPIRNKQMAEYADALLLIWDGKSRGSANMKHEMEFLGKPVYEVVV